MPYRLVQPSFFKAKIDNEDAMQASLIHFIGAIKPWTTYNQSVPIVKVWAQAKANSPWKMFRSMPRLVRKQFIKLQEMPDGAIVMEK